MAQYSPPNGDYPQELPDRWVFENGSIRTDLRSLSDTELNELGWSGPITMPEDIVGYNEYTHSYTWNTQTRSFDIEELSQIEKEKKVDYQYFWDLLVYGAGTITDGVITNDGIAYTKIKNTAKTSLEVNVIVTEFISYLTDAKNGKVYKDKIQETLTELFSAVTFTTGELEEIQNAFNRSGMFTTYTLP
tara:strand:+ start:450 stop:1016 length:567 start_codon:yes stop_codon:yes gene_type:complete